LITDPPKTAEERDPEEGGVAIVGNGGSLLGAGLGEAIDRHDVVVRFNLFKLEGFGADVGSKTTLWFSNRDARPAMVASMLARHTFSGIYVHTWNNTADAVASFREALQQQGLDTATPVMPVEKAVISEMKAYLGGGYSLFSTGAIGTWMMLKKHRHVSLFGFDWWRQTSSEPFHYGDNLRFDFKPDSGHQPQIELAFFKKLEAEGRLRFGGAPK
jgi:hypothetical protein